MKKIKKFAIAIIGTIALFSISSCKKVWDYIDDHHPDTKEKSRIDKIYYTEYFYDPKAELGSPGMLFNDTAEFKYDTKNQLIAVDYAAARANLTPNVYPVLGLIFLYDNQGRLVAYFDEALYYNQDEIGCQFAHKYTYVNDHYVIDSPFVYAGALLKDGKLVKVVGNHGYPEALYLTLDDKGRIIKEESDVYPAKMYTYDTNGNLVLPGVAYTNNKNIYQTDAVFKLITRNYSVNTPIGSASEFNANKLPVKFNSGKLPFLVRNTYYNGQNDFYDKQNIRITYTKP